MKKLKILIVLLLSMTPALIIGFIIGNNHNQLTAKEVINQEVDERLDSLIVLDTPKGILDIIIRKDEIWFEPFLKQNSDNFFSVIIDKAHYPKLFNQGMANYSFISARIVEDEKVGKIAVEVSNNQPDHGSYSRAYRLVVNPLTGTVKEADVSYPEY